MQKTYDSIIIGAGLSGLAAGIRLAQYGKKVLLLEKHYVVGGLNSFYHRFGRRIDVGLHAVTNFVKKGVTNSPLCKLLRQLRIPYDALELCEQRSSKIVYNEHRLSFTNDFSIFESEIGRLFPGAVDSFRKLVKIIKEYNPFTICDQDDVSARQVISEIINNQTVEDMILLPILYYGSARDNDVSWNQFVILFRSIFLEGFSRPFEGIKKILTLLLDKFHYLGGDRRMRAEVKTIAAHSGRAHGVELTNGEYIPCKDVLSTIGYPETMNLLHIDRDVHMIPAGQLSFCEAIAISSDQPGIYGWNDTITFFAYGDRFRYTASDGTHSTDSGVVCIPNNFIFSDGKCMDDGILRVTALSNYHQWQRLSASDYAQQKQVAYNDLISRACYVLDGGVSCDQFQKNIIVKDLFTPLTVERYTGRINGAIYGSPVKVKDGVLPIKNVYIAGTDQGFLGIIGSMLSGISIANQHMLM